MNIMKRHAIGSAPDRTDLESVTATFKALSDPTRIHIILALAAEEHTVGELVSTLGAPQSTVSRHLAVLRGNRIVETRRQANLVYYRLAHGHVGDLVREAFAHAEHKRLGLPPHGSNGGT